MYIQVVSAKDGRHELITVNDPVEVVRGANLNRLICGEVEHWFKKDGTYDGWGINLKETKMTPEEMIEFIDAVDRNRVFP